MLFWGTNTNSFELITEENFFFRNRSLDGMAAGSERKSLNTNGPFKVFFESDLKSSRKC
jgi:hypothetical protein